MTCESCGKKCPIYASGEMFFIMRIFCERKKEGEREIIKEARISEDNMRHPAYFMLIREYKR